jgi:pre-mRNA-processing factor 40
MTYRRAIPYLDRDSRFHSLDSDAEREDLFEEFVFDLEKRQREDYKIMRREHMNKLREVFQQDTTITVRTHWREIKEGWKDHSIFRSLERADRLTVFEDHIKDLEKREMEEQRIQRETMRRQHRKNRDAFKVSYQ